MKAQEREEARRLRKEDGMSVNEMAKRLGVSKGSVSMWVRDIELSNEQKILLSERCKFSINQQKGCKAMKDKAESIRKEFQKSGRDFVKNNQSNLDYKIFCALYWAEGDKSRNSPGMTNTDPEMLKIFINILRKYFSLNDESFTVRVMAHLGNGLSSEQICDYWLKILGLPKSCFRQFVLKSKYFPVQNKKHKRHVYGGCTVRVNSVEIMQKIYGSIQEVFGIDRPEWLWG